MICYKSIQIIRQIKTLVLHENANVNFDYSINDLSTVRAQYNK